MVRDSLRPRLLDLFCGAGGAAVGYHRAGFDVFGVDLDETMLDQYPYPCEQADALTFPLDDFDAIHASPPCQDHSTLSARAGSHGTGWMLTHTIARLQGSWLPYVVENVPGSGPSMPGQWTMLCGSSFGLAVRRHRLFHSSMLILAPSCNHSAQGTPLGVYGVGGGGKMTRGTKARPDEAKVAMGIDWMTHRAIAQAIPPAYTEHIGRQLIGAV
jgi:DNA (cytosine-5)-methyltransferase 1